MAGVEARTSSAARNQVVLVATQVGRLVIGLATTALLGRNLEPADFGFYALVASILFLGHAAMDVGMGALAVREIARTPERERSLIEALIGWRRVVGAALALGIIAWSMTLPAGSARLVISGAALALVLLAHGVINAALQVRQAVAGPAVFGVVSQVLVLAGAAVFPITGLPGASVAGLVVLREVLDVSFLRFWGRRRMGYGLRPGLRGRGLPAFLAMAVVPGAATVVQSLYFHADVFLVRSLRGEEELGAYAAAFRLVNPVLLLPGLALIPLAPLLARAARSDRPRFVELARGASASFLGVGALAGVSGWFLAPDILALLYGGAYLRGPLEAVGAFRWIAVAVMLVFATAPRMAALFADGGERDLLVLGVAGLGMNVLANLIFIPRFGFVAASWTTAATEGAVLLGATLALRSRISVPLFCRAHLLVLLPGAGLALLLGTLGGGPGLRVGMGCLAGAAGVLATLALPVSRQLRALQRVVEARDGRGR